jgi:hypothetical protein
MFPDSIARERDNAAGNVVLTLARTSATSGLRSLLWGPPTLSPFFVSVDDKEVADENFVSVDVKRLSREGWQCDSGELKRGCRACAGPTPPFLKACDSKGFADALLRKCINLKALLSSEWSFGSRCSLRTTILGRMVVLKVFESKGFADAFLRKCVKLKSLGGISASSEVSGSLWQSLLACFRASRAS